VVTGAVPGAPLQNSQSAGPQVGSPIEHAFTERESRQMFTAAHLDATPLIGIAGKSPWATVGRLFGPWQYSDENVCMLIIFSFSGLALSLFAVERFPSLVAMIAACP
jgi:hypothetical protein